ncbi:MAG: hypothetical protein Q7W55_04940 [Pseudohongiella sp.]|nr:hypothetical protein [Pseudohongiella sp.]MDO9519023.1 hypothetical protein [Pseudohongiella sp.]
MKSRISLSNTFELILALATIGLLLAVLQSFVIGRHYIIPTTQLAAALVLGNIAWYGFSGQLWAKLLLFWSGVLLCCHLFFALFWSKAYRDILGVAFEPVCLLLLILFVWLTVQYKRRNHLFARSA